MSSSIFLGEITSAIPDKPDHGLDATWPDGQTTAQVIFDLLTVGERSTNINVSSIGATTLWFHRHDNVWVQINLLPDGRVTLELGEPAA